MGTLLRAVRILRVLIRKSNGECNSCSKLKHVGLPRTDTFFEIRKATADGSLISGPQADVDVDVLKPQEAEACDSTPDDVTRNVAVHAVAAAAFATVSLGGGNCASPISGQRFTHFETLHYALTTPLKVISNFPKPQTHQHKSTPWTKISSP
jgi:hypothetical protein